MSKHRPIETRVVTWTVSRSIGCGHHGLGARRQGQPAVPRLRRGEERSAGAAQEVEARMKIAHVIDRVMLALGWLCVLGMVVSLVGLVVCWLMGVR
jgi:hypothetical protein